MINKLNKLRENSSEEGFTLIELMVVVVIIAILAAIAIPIFSNQQKSAIGATLKSDVKNTSINVATELVSSNDPEKADVVETGENQVVISGTWDNYTITGTNENADPACVMFTSTTGKITECNTGTGGTGSGTGGTGSGTGGTGTSLGLFITGKWSQTSGDGYPYYFQSEALGYKDGETTSYVIPNTFYGQPIYSVFVNNVVICDVKQMSKMSAGYCSSPIPATFTVNGETVVSQSYDSTFTFTPGDVVTISTTLN